MFLLIKARKVDYVLCLVAVHIESLELLAPSCDNEGTQAKRVNQQVGNEKQKNEVRPR